MPRRSPTNAVTVHHIHCPICSKIEKMEGSAMEVAETLVEGGWHWSSQIEEDDTWYLVCPDHYHSPTSRRILKDADEDPRPVNLPLIS